MDVRKVVDVKPGLGQSTTTVRSEAEHLPLSHFQCTSAAAKLEPRWVALTEFPKAALADRVLWLYAAHALSSGSACKFVLINPGTREIGFEWASLLLDPAVNKTELRSNVELRVSRLAKIKATFGLSNSDLARVCRISRTQLYKWLSPDEGTQLTQANWQRLADLSRFAEDWGLLSSKPARVVLNETLINGQTLLDILSAPQLDHRLIRRALQQLATVIAGRPMRRDEKLRQRGVKPAVRAGQLTWDE